MIVRFIIEDPTDIFEEQAEIPNVDEKYSFRTNCSVREEWLNNKLSFIRHKYELDGRLHRIWMEIESKISELIASETF